MEGAQVLERQPLERDDEPGDVSAWVPHVIVVQVDRRGAPTAQDHVLGDVAAVPDAVGDGPGRRRPGFALLEQQLRLAGERRAEAGDQVRPVTVTGTLSSKVSRFAQ